MGPGLPEQPPAKPCRSYGYIRIILGLYIGIMEKKMETTIHGFRVTRLGFSVTLMQYRGYTGTMESKRETTI